MLLPCAEKASRSIHAQSVANHVMNNRTPILSIIIPTFNNWSLTRQALTSLAKHTAGRFFEVLLVDNNSTDETRQEAPLLGRQLFKDAFSFFPQQSNINFGPACNLGAHHARGTFLFFLNNDVELTANWWPPLLQEAQQSRRLGALSPLLLYPGSHTVQHAGIAFDPTLAPVHLYADFPADHPAVLRKKNIQALSAAALCIPRTTFLSIGGFFPGYRNGYEDLDLCAQLQRQNLELRVVTQSRIIHFESASSGRFDAETHNARLLGERCFGIFFPDLHRHGMTDGFTPSLTQWASFTLKDDTPEASSSDDLFALLEAHPLSGRVHDSIIDRYIETREGTRATQCLLRACRLCPSLDRYTRLADLTQQYAPNLHDTIVGQLNHITRSMADKAPLLKRTQGLADWSRRAGETELAQLYSRYSASL